MTRPRPPHAADLTAGAPPAAITAAGEELPLSVWATAQHDARAQRRGRYLFCV